MSIFKTTVPEGLDGVTLCLTGASGYVGQHLVQSLTALGIRPLLIGRPRAQAPDIVGADTVGTWNNPTELAAALDRYTRLAVLNIAGHFVSHHSPSDIAPLVSGNLEFPLNIFEALALSRHDRIVNVGTSWEFSDTGAPTPANLYASLKASNVAALVWYANAFGLRAVNLKLNDTFGGADGRAKLMPLLKKSAETGAKTALRYSDQEINLLHITDVKEGLLAAAELTGELTPGTVPTAFLLGPETLTLGALIDRLRKGAAPGLDITFEQANPVGGTLRSVWEAAPRLANWCPRISLDDGLSEYFGKINET